MWEQGVLLEYGVELSLVRRKVRDVLPVENDLSLIRRLKSA